MTPTVSWPHKKAALFLSILTIFCLGFGCILSPGDDKKDPDPGGGGEDPIDRKTRQSLLEDYFKDVYVRGDSVGYAAMLDSRYEFENLPISPDNPVVETWSRADELRIAGRMFNGWINPDGVKVLDIAFDLIYQDDLESSAFFQDQPADQTWYKVLTEVSLTVVTQDPSASDGSGIVNRVVFSNQDFVVRPDENDPELWTIRRQVDREALTG